MLLDVVADNRERQAKATGANQEVTIRQSAPGVTEIGAQTDHRAIEAFLEDEANEGDPFARLAESFPGIFGGEEAQAARSEAQATPPPDDMDPAQVAALLGQLGLADKE